MIDNYGVPPVKLCTLLLPDQSLLLEFMSTRIVFLDRRGGLEIINIRLVIHNYGNWALKVVMEVVMEMVMVPRQ